MTDGFHLDGVLFILYVSIGMFVCIFIAAVLEHWRGED